MLLFKLYFGFHHSADRPTDRLPFGHEGGAVAELRQALAFTSSHRCQRGFYNNFIEGFGNIRENWLEERRFEWREQRGRQFSDLVRRFNAEKKAQRTESCAQMEKVLFFSPINHPNPHWLTVCWPIYKVRVGELGSDLGDGWCRLQQVRWKAERFV